MGDSCFSFIPWYVPVALAGVYCTFFVSSNHRDIGRFLRGLRKQPPAGRIADLTVGSAACIEGEVSADAALITPCRRLTAIGYQLWTTSASTYYDSIFSVHEVCEFRPFWVDDGNGRVFVDPRKDNIFVKVARPPFEPFYDAPSAELWAALEDSGADAASRLSAPDLTIAEWALTAGARVRVRGLVCEEVDPAGRSDDYRSAPKRLVLRSAPGVGLTLEVLVA